MTREDGSGDVAVGRKRPSQLDSDIGVQARSPHEHEILAEFVDPHRLCVAHGLVFLARVEKELECVAYPSSSVQKLELVGE